MGNLMTLPNGVEYYMISVFSTDVVMNIKALLAFAYQQAFRQHLKMLIRQYFLVPCPLVSFPLSSRFNEPVYKTSAGH